MQTRSQNRSAELLALRWLAFHIAIGLLLALASGIAFAGQSPRQAAAEVVVPLFLSKMLDISEKDVVVEQVEEGADQKVTARARLPKAICVLLLAPSAEPKVGLLLVEKVSCDPIPSTAQPKLAN